MLSTGTNLYNSGCNVMMTLPKSEYIILTWFNPKYIFFKFLAAHINSQMYLRFHFNNQFGNYYLQNKKQNVYPHMRSDLNKIGGWLQSLLLIF